MLAHSYTGKARLHVPELCIETDRQVVTVDSYVKYDPRARRPVRVTMFGLAVVLANGGSANAYFQMAGREPAWTLEKLERGLWRAVYVPVRAMVYTQPLELPPGAEYRSCVTIYTEPQSQPRLDVSTVPGAYRVAYRVFARWRQGCPGAMDELVSPLAPEMCVSNTFYVAA